MKEHRVAIVFIEPDGPEIDALKRLGLTETYRRPHPGQGTAPVWVCLTHPRRGRQKRSLPD